MRWIYLILILIFTIVGGMIPVWYRRIHRNVIVYLLTFTGAFLLGITILHLAPESFHELGKKAGLYILLGFFLQVFLQRWSHGMEHGHGASPQDQVKDHAGQVTAATAFSLVVGLSVHAFMAGLPLGFTYHDPSILPSLALGILLHKMPEALTLMTMLLVMRAGKKGNKGLLILFSLVTPGAALLAYALNQDFLFMDRVLLYVIALVTGAFLHISTTIFFESGTRHHELNRGKVISMVIGLALASLTLLIG
ncbi:MAG TPA: ZIP family metal transporter [Chitinophagaceae bacterium]|nr:ZIP family metal transporter [Chitinophagaceae bacterium]